MSEARPLSTRFCYNSDRDSDGSTDQDNKGYTHERPFTKRTGLSNIWETDFDNKTGLYIHSLGHEIKQRGADQQKKSECGHDFINRTSQVQTQHKEPESVDNFGGKSCHPKMRAKLLFRSGDFDNSSWGYQLEEAENDTKKSSDSVFEEKSTNSENHIDVLSSENNSHVCQNDTNGNYLPNLDCLTPSPSSDKDENGNSDTKMDLDTTSSLTENVTETRGSNEKPLKDKPHEYDIWVTEVTHDCLTVTFMESPTERGFFKERNDA